MLQTQKTQRTLYFCNGLNACNHTEHQLSQKATILKTASIAAGAIYGITGTVTIPQAHQEKYLWPGDPKSCQETQEFSSYPWHLLNALEAPESPEYMQNS